MPCNHIFHTSCLRSWFQRHQTCPTCRLDILRPIPVNQPSATVSEPPPSVSPTPAPPTAEVSTSSTSTSTSINTDASGQNPSGHNQAGNVNNPFYNQIPLPYQFRPYTFQQPQASVDENNSNINDNSTSSEPQSINMNESWGEFMNMPRQSFFNKQTAITINKIFIFCIYYVCI